MITQAKPRRTRATKYAMKIIPSPVKYAYIENSQPTADKFSLAYREGDCLYQIFNPVKCREYFADIFGVLEGIRKDKFVYGMNIQEIAAKAEGKELWLLHHDNEKPELFNDGDILLAGNTIACPLPESWISTSIAITYYTSIMRWRRNPSLSDVWMSDSQMDEVASWLPHLRTAAEGLGLNGFYCVDKGWAGNANQHTRGFKNFYLQNTNVHDAWLRDICRQKVKAA